MQFTILINQSRALEWGLNTQQAMLFSFLYGVPAWADSTQLNGVTCYRLCKSKICKELPLLTDKPNTVYVLLTKLQDTGLINLSLIDNQTHFSFTKKAALWNSTEHHSEVGNGSEGLKKIKGGVGKKSELGSEKNQTNHITINQITNNQNASVCEVGEKPKRSTGQTLTTWLTEVKAAGQMAIPPEHSIFVWADKAGVTDEMVAITWNEFKDKYTDNQKKYIDWRKHFANYLRNNWFQLWYKGRDGTLQLTNKGLIARDVLAQSNQVAE